MAVDDPYLSVADFKARIGMISDSSDDALERTLKAASRQIDRICGRHFNQDGTEMSPAIRYVTARYTDIIDAGDVVSLAGVASDSAGDGTYETTWLTTDWELAPWNAGELGYPYTELTLTYGGSYSFPAGARRGVRLTGIFGWPAVPDAIAEATGLQANRLWARTKAPFGVVGAPNDLGQLTAITNFDPDVRSLVMPYRVQTL